MLVLVVKTLEGARTLFKEDRHQRKQHVDIELIAAIKLNRIRQLDVWC